MNKPVVSIAERITYIDEWDLPPACRRSVAGGRFVVNPTRKPTLQEVATAIEKAERRSRPSTVDRQQSTKETP